MRKIAAVLVGTELKCITKLLGSLRNKILTSHYLQENR